LQGTSGQEATPVATAPSGLALAHRMSLLVRATGFLLGMLVTALAAILLFVSVSYSDKQIGIDIRDFVETEYDRVLITEGDIHLALWPWPRLQIGATSLTEPNRPDTFGSWKSASFELDALALLSHRLVIRHARIEGLTLRLARDRKGVWNVADLLANNADPNDDAATDVDTPFLLQLEGLALSHASVVMEDAVSGRNLQWRELELGTDAWRARRGGRIQLISQVISPSAALQGKLSVSTRYRFGDTLASGMLTGTRLHYVGDISRLKAADITLGWGSAEWQKDEWKLADAQLAGSSKLNTQALEWTAALLSASWHDGLQAKSASARLKLLAADAASAGGEVHLSLRELVPGEKGVGTAQIEGNWLLQATGRGTQGKLRAALRHDARAGQLSLANIAGDLALTHPALNAANAHALLQGRASWLWSASRDAPEAAHAELDLNAAFGKDVLHVVASLATGIATPVLTARVDSAHFDVDRLLAAGQHFPALPAVNDLQGWALDGVVHADNMKIGGMQLASVHVPVRIEEGELSLPEHEIRLYGGRLSGSLAYEPAEQKLTIFEALREVQLDALTRDMKTALPLTGLGNATLDVHGEGMQWKDMPEKAKGVLRFYAKNARWHGVDLPRSMLALHTGKTATGTAQSATPLSEVSAAFSIDGPTLVADKLTAHSDAVALTGSGNIQYASGQMDLLLNARLAGSGGNDKAFVELRGKRMSLRAKGRIMQPQLRVDAQPARPQPAKVQPVIVSR